MVRIMRCKLFNPKCNVGTCTTSSDCASKKPRTICVESGETGKKTCTKPTKKICDGKCPPDKYCTAKNKCRNGKT